MFDWAAARSSGCSDNVSDSEAISTSKKISKIYLENV